jgi:hypothetical protein
MFFAPNALPMTMAIGMAKRYQLYLLITGNNYKNKNTAWLQTMPYFLFIRLWFLRIATSPTR